VKSVADVSSLVYIFHSTSPARGTHGAAHRDPSPSFRERIQVFVRAHEKYLENS
jgi:hypothetical protein